MAIKISFEGFVESVRDFDWGTVYNMSHTQWRKEGEEFVAAGKDYLNVIAPPNSAQEGDKVAVEGRMKTKRFEKKDGTWGQSLEVRSDSFTVTKKGQEQTYSQQLESVWPEVQQIPDDAPF